MAIEEKNLDKFEANDELVKEQGVGMTKQNEKVEEPVTDGSQGSEEVFPGGPTKSKVENWKSQFGDVYMTEYDSGTYIWRALKRQEYKQIMNSEGDNSEWFKEEQVTQLCVLWPENYGINAITDGDAGIPSSLTDEIMAKSGFVPTSKSQKL